MWHKRTARDELAEKILDKIPRSVKREYDVETYARDYASRLPIGNVKPGDEKLVKRGIEDVYSRISENKNK